MTKLAYLLLAACTASAAAPPAERARSSTLIAPGTVEPHRDPVKLGFEITGRIVAIDVEEGDRVTAKQALAHLDDRLAKARVASAQAAVDSAGARLSLLRRGPRAEDVAAARADADAAVASAKHRAIEQGRSDSLGKLGAVTTAVDADDAAARVATAQATAAQARARSLELGTRQESIAEAAAQLAAAKAELDAANVALDQTVLRAPADGVILRRTAEVGALVQTLTPVPVVTFADVQHLELRAEIDEADLAAVTVGQTAYATADAFGTKRFPVHVARITGELGRKAARDDDPRARVDTRVLEVVATFDQSAPPFGGAAAPVEAGRVEQPQALPIGLRMSLHYAR